MLWTVRGAETAVLAYVVIAARAWWFPVALFLGLLALVLGIALVATTVRLREVTVHDRRASLYLATYGGSDFMPGEGDEAARARVGRRP